MDVTTRKCAQKKVDLRHVLMTANGGIFVFAVYHIPGQRRGVTGVGRSPNKKQAGVTASSHTADVCPHQTLTSSTTNMASPFSLRLECRNASY